MELNYLLFHLIFVVPILLILLAIQPNYDRNKRKLKVAGFGFLLFLCYAYTIPWDNIMIEIGVWSYENSAVMFYIWNAPLGEYLFFGFQTVITGLWLHIIGFRHSFEEGDLKRVYRLAGIVVLALISVFFVLSIGDSRMLYMSSIVLWCVPVIGIQWLVGGSYLIREKKMVALAVLPPTIYYSAIDYIAIEMGLWTISEQYSTGLMFGSIPVEEILFFLATNIMVVFGLSLYSWVFYNRNLYGVLYDRLGI